MAQESEFIGAVNTVFTIRIANIEIPITESIVVMWIIMIVLIIGAKLVTKKLQLVPEGIQNVVETFLETIQRFIEGIAGHHTRTIFPFLCTLFIFLIFANAISVFIVFPTACDLYAITGWSVFEHLPNIRIHPPTMDVNVTLALAVFSVSSIVIFGIRAKKPLGFMKVHFQPVAVIFPIKMLEYLIRVISLCFRLFGNVLAAFIIMEIFFHLMPFALPAFLSIYFDLFDGILQAFVFVFFSTLYLSEIME